MKLILKRIYFGNNYTIGKLYLDYEDNTKPIWFCDTLEDKYRDLNKEPKVYGETAIPYGNYEFIITGHIKWKIDVPLLLNVPHFTSILIHMGTDEKNTEGCILVGYNSIKGKLTDSRHTFDMLMKELKEHKQDSYKIEIK